MSLLIPVTLLLGNPASLEADVDPEILTPSAPVLRTDNSPGVRPIQVGDKIVITTQVANNDPVYDWSSYVLVEVRDQDGVTTLLSWQSGILKTGSRMEVGISWTPDHAGEYNLRTFVVSDLQNPWVMSSVKETHVTIVDRTDGHCSGSASCFVGVVTKIVDGDTLDVDNTRVRLSLVDTPEIGEGGYDDATEFTSELCLVGSSVVVDQDDGQLMDDFGRMIAKVICEGDMVINAELLSSGHAQVLREYCDESEFSTESWVEAACREEGKPAQENPETPISLRPNEDCDISYPDVCIPSPPPDLDCGDVSYRNFKVAGSDPHRFDIDKDGIGCEG